MSPTADTSRKPVFLTAAWKNLAMINYECDPAVLKSRIPAGTELDSWNGKTYISMVGFQFLHTRVLGIPFPFHRNFEEVNLRFYVRRKTEGNWRRGVVFVRELVPRSAIAWMARNLYEEPYLAVPMSHKIRQDGDTIRSVRYSWRYQNRDHHLQMELEPGSHALQPGTQAEFIAEHYWGYTSRKNGRCSEYKVVHPPWRVQNATTSELDCDVSALYGRAFHAPLSTTPDSAFLALGSEVSVHHGTTVKS